MLNFRPPTSAALGGLTNTNEANLSVGFNFAFTRGGAITFAMLLTISHALLSAQLLAGWLGPRSELISLLER